jgi:hypothetical protein
MSPTAKILGLWFGVSDTLHGAQVGDGRRNGMDPATADPAS